MYKLDKLNLREKLLKLSNQDSHQQIKDHIVDIVKKMDDEKKQPTESQKSIPEDTPENEKLKKLHEDIHVDYEEQREKDRELVKRLIENVKKDKKFLMREKVLNLIEKKNL